MSGFQHAGVTKGIMIVLGLSTLGASLFDIKPYLHLQLVPHITKYHQFWRIAIHPFAFANSTELLLGELLLYNAGVAVERAFGSRKYASFILVSSLFSTFLASVSILLFHGLGLNSIPAGPYGIIFSLLWQQYRIFPSLYHFRILGLELSSKAFNWILASQLILSKPPSSTLISLCGLLAGYIYRTDTLFPLPSLSISRRRLLVRRSLKSYRIPLSIHRLLARIFSPLVGQSLAPRRSQRVLPGQPSRGASSAVRMGPVPVGATATGTATGTAAGAGLGAGAGAGGGGARPSLRSILASRLATTAAAGGLPSPTTSEGRRGGADSGNEQTDRGGRTDGAGSEREGGEPGSATAAMGEWVNEMTGRGGMRAPTEDEIGTLSNMFPNLGREVIVRALQTNNYNTAQAVEALLEDSG